MDWDSEDDCGSCSATEPYVEGGLLAEEELGESVEEFAEMWKGVRIPSLKENRGALAVKAGAGGYRATVAEMGRFMVSQKLLAKAVTADAMVSADYLPEK
jgi:hypothetical protein